MIIPSQLPAQSLLDPPCYQPPARPSEFFRLSMRKPVSSPRKQLLSIVNCKNPLLKPAELVPQLPHKRQNLIYKIWIFSQLNELRLATFIFASSIINFDSSNK
jgi:hypothetical protein